MSAATSTRIAAWTLSAITVVFALFAWWPNINNINSYSLFPLFGLIAFGLMWSHYVSGAISDSLGAPDGTLKRHFQITAYIVLVAILAHPLILEIQLYLDGFGLPPGSLFEVYPSIIEKTAILMGVTALGCFLVYELHRFYRERSWWKYVEWANIGAMGLILVHGFLLGGELNLRWFQIIWVTYALTFVASVIISYASKVKE